MTFEVNRSIRNTLSRQSASLYDPLTMPAGGSVQPTYHAVRSVIAPPSSAVQRLTAQTGQTYPDTMPVPGQLGTWQPSDQYKPHQQIGKFGVNLLGPSPTTMPGQVQPWTEQYQQISAAERLQTMAAPENPENRGFFEGLLSGFGGLLGDVGRTVGGFVGSVADAPLEAAGNIAGLPLAVASGAAFSGEWDNEVQAAYDAAARENPLNGLLLWGQAAKAQWQKDVEAGRMTGLWADYGPATALTDQLGLAMNIILGGPSRAVQRAIMSGKEGGLAIESIKAVEEAVRSGAETFIDETTGAVKSTDEAIKNDNWAQIQMRLARGDFGDPTSNDPKVVQERRDKMLDQLIIEGAMLRDVGDVEQTSPVFVTPQGIADIGISMLTDPWMIASFGIVGGATKAAKMAQVGANDLLINAVTKGATGAERVTRARGFIDKIEEVGMRLMPEGSSPEQTWNRLAASTREQVSRRLEGGLQTATPSRSFDRAFENEVYQQALREFEGGKYLDDGMSAWSHIERWRDVWEPAVRPIVNVVNAVNDPFQLFGKGRADRLVGKIYSSQVTEGVIRGQGSLDDHAGLQGILKSVGGDDAVKAYDDNLGVYAGHESKVYARAGFVSSDMKHRLEKEGEESIRDVLSMYPDDVVRARMNGSTPGDIASALEMQVARFRPKYLFGGRSREASLELGRRQAKDRLMRMANLSEEQAQQAVSQMNFNHISLIDGAYFGYAMDSFLKVRDVGRHLSASAAKDVNYETLTMLGPRQMTKQSAERVLAMIERGDIDGVRQAIQEYDLLFENLSAKAGDDDLLRAVDILVRDQREVLPNEIEDLTALTPEMRAWAESNQGFGYKLGHRAEKPEDMWRVTMDPDGSGRVLGVNPWIDPSGMATATGRVEMNRWQLAKDMLFHNIRGERIMLDAKHRLGEHTTRLWGISPQQSDALFARFLKQAQTEGITPRGMRAEAVFKVVMTHGLPKEIEDRIGKSQAVEALLFAFEGNWKHVGSSQKFTGYAKTTLGGQGNYLGQVAEKIYPMVRFSLNPLFQAQELAEPFILNVMRGVKPGFRPDEMDDETIRLVEFLLGDSKFAFDDAIEYGGSLLMGGNQAHTAFGANTALGKMVRRAGEQRAGGIRRGFRRTELTPEELAAEGIEGATGPVYRRSFGIDVQGIKKVNYARALRKRLGKEMQDTLVGMTARGGKEGAEQGMAEAGSVAARLLHELPLEYGTADWGEIAVKYLTNKGNVPKHLTPTRLFKPASVGRLEPIQLEDLVPHLDGYDTVEAIQTAVRNGDLDLPAFKTLMKEAGAGDPYIERAWRRAGARWSEQEFWDGWQAVNNASAADRKAARTIWRNVANAKGMDEQDYLYQRMAAVPMKVDEAHLAAEAPSDKLHFQHYSEVQREVGGRTAAADERLTKFMHEDAWGTDRESFLIANKDTGEVIHRGSANEAWEVRPDGAVANASITEDVLTDQVMAKAKGQIMGHTHPTHSPHSPADMVGAARWQPAEEVVASPGIIHSLLPHAEQGWYTDDFIRLFGEPPEPLVGGTVDDEFLGSLDTQHYWYGDSEGNEGVLGGIKAMWFKEGREEKDRLMLDPFFAGRENEFFNWYAEQLAVEHATRSVAERLGWRFNSKTNFNLTTDEFAKTRLINDMMDSAPEAQRRLAPGPYGHERFTRTDVAHGADIDFAYSSRHRPWEPPGLSDDDWQIVSTAHEDWARGRALTMLGMAVTDVRRNMAMREGGNMAHTVWNAIGPDDMHEDAARMMGLLLKQDKVEVSTVIPNGMAADPAQGQRWSLNFVADRQMTDDEANALAAQLQAAMPTAGPASHVITRDGRTALRFVERDLDAPMLRGDFNLQPVSRAARSAEVSDLLEASGIQFENVADVVNWRSIENDWEVHPHGEAYLEGIRVRRSDVARRIEHGLIQESEDKLASLLRAADPERWDAHIDALAAAGTPAPRFAVPGEYTPRPLADRVTVNLPGGVERLMNDPLAEFSLWEQQGIKALMLDPLAIYQGNPLLGIRLQRATARGKYKNLEGVLDLEDHYNAYAFGQLSGEATLEQTEGAYSLVRASNVPVPTRTGPELNRSLPGLEKRFRRIVNQLIPPTTRDEDIRGVIEGLDDAVVGFQVQMDEGLMVSSMDLHQASWLSASDAQNIENILARIDERLGAMSAERRKAWVPRLQKRLDANPPRGQRIVVTDYPLQSVDSRAANLQDPLTGEIIGGEEHSFSALVRPDTQFMGKATNEQWGRLAKQHASGLWNSENPAVRRFMKPMPGESRSAYSLRIGSIVPGVDPTTGLLSMQAASPGMLDHAPLDPALTGFIARKASDRGEWGVLRQPFETPPVQPPVKPHLPDNYDDLTHEQQTAFFRDVMDPARAEFAAWETQVKRGYAMGQISDEQLAEYTKNGLYMGSRESVEIPAETYHATTAMSKVTAEGLRTREEVAYKAALGGGPEDTVSLTTDKAIADRIAEVLLEARQVARGEITVEQLMERAEAGGFLTGPNSLVAMKYNNPPGAPENMVAFRQRYVEHITTERSSDVTGRGLVASRDEMPPGAIPRGDGITGGDGITRWASWDRPMTADEVAEADFEAYRAFTLAQEAAGGPMDPMFWSPNVKELAAMDPAEIGVVTVHAKPGAKGIRVSSLGEIRVQTGEALEVVGRRQTLREQLSAGYADQITETLKSGSDEFPVPSVKHDFLVPDEWKGKPWSAGKEAAMRERLHLIRDPEVRAMYAEESGEVLRYVSQTDGRINHMEGDYFALNDYLLTTIRGEEADALRAAGHTQAADELAALSGGDYASMKMSHVRATQGMPLDPHVSIARGAELFSPRSGAEQTRNMTVGSLTNTPYDPSRMRLQQIDGQILGATQIDEDGKAIMMATQHADARTGLHELAHVLWGDLDDSAKITVLREYRLATGSKVRSLNNRGLQEWWADSLYAYGQSKGAKGNEALRFSFEHVRKTLDNIEAGIKTERAGKALATDKKKAITRATKAVERYKEPLREAKIATGKLATARKTAADNLRKVRQRTGVAVFEGKADQANVAVQVAEQGLKDARSAVRQAKEAARLAESKAKSALGTPAAGGARRSANAKAAQISKAEAEVARLNKALEKTLRPARTEANIALRNAKRRLPTEEIATRHEIAKGAHEKALAKQREIQRMADDADKALADAKGLRTKPPKQRADQMPMSDNMRKVWKALTTPPEKPSMIQPTGTHYNIQEEAVYQAMLHALSRAEENAHTLHYYARGRSLVERSINHPYFGLYPSSYMWGKILPELTRFLLKNPFGLDAPLGGLALSHNLYRQVMTRQTYDVDFRKKMSDSTDMWHLVALMTPALPWEIPVNAPLWMRRISQNALIRDDKLLDQEQRAATGQLKPSEFDQYGNVIPPPMQDIEDVTSVVRDMLGYAFGPANAAELVGTGLGALPFGAPAVDEGALAQVQALMAGGGVGGNTPRVAGVPSQPGGTVPIQQGPAGSY